MIALTRLKMKSTIDHCVKLSTLQDENKTKWDFGWNGTLLKLFLAHPVSDLSQSSSACATVRHSCFCHHLWSTCTLKYLWTSTAMQRMLLLMSLPNRKTAIQKVMADRLKAVHQWVPFRIQKEPLDMPSWSKASILSIKIDELIAGLCVCVRSITDSKMVP